VIHLGGHSREGCGIVVGRTRYPAGFGHALSLSEPSAEWLAGLGRWLYSNRDE
jgi:hypothetical protein